MKKRNERIFLFAPMPIYYYSLSIYYIYVQLVPKKNLLWFLGKTRWYFPKLFLNSKISCIYMSFKLEISILSHIAKSCRLINFWKRSQGSVKSKIFGLILGKNSYYFVHKFYLFKTRNSKLRVRSTTKTV